MDRAATRFFGMVINSTIWTQPPATRVVWLTLLAIADESGSIYSSVPGLARTANVTFEECEAAVAYLTRDEPMGFQKADHGRRISVIEDGWLINGYAQMKLHMRKAARMEDRRRAKMEQRRRDRKSGIVEIRRRRPASIVVVQAPLTPFVTPSITSPSVTTSHQTELPGVVNKSEPAPVTTKPEVTSMAVDFVDWFLLLLKQTGARMPQLTDSICDRWAQIYDELIRLDKRDPEEIKRVCTWARNDPFWKSNFLSPGKLRDRAKGTDLKYYELLYNKMKESGGKKKTAMA